MCIDDVFYIFLSLYQGLKCVFEMFVCGHFAYNWEVQPEQSKLKPLSIHMRIFPKEKKIKYLRCNQSKSGYFARG